MLRKVSLIALALSLCLPLVSAAQSTTDPNARMAAFRRRDPHQAGTSLP